MATETEDKTELEMQAERIATAPLATGAEGHTQLLMMLILEQGRQMRADAAAHRDAIGKVADAVSAVNARVDNLHERITGIYRWIIGVGGIGVISLLIAIFREWIVGRL